MFWLMVTIRKSISEREPRKGTETIMEVKLNKEEMLNISEREPRKGTETPTMKHWLNTYNSFSISEREPRKGTETTRPNPHSPLRI